jgi:hypothetical protein
VVRRQALALLALGGTLGVAACGNILGLKDLEPYPTEGGADGADDQSPDSPATGDGTSTGDANDGAVKNDAHEEDGTTAGDVAEDTKTDVTGNDVVTTDTTPPPDSPTSCGSGETMCGGTCVNTSSDGSNCGSCGHSCQGGMCTSSSCGPVLMNATASPFDIVVVDSSLYWVDQASAVWSCPIASCVPVKVVPGQQQPTRIAWDGANAVFWTNHGNGGGASIGALNLTSMVASTLSVSVTAPEGIAANTTYVFWADTGAQNVVRYDRATNSPATLMTGNGTNPAGMTLCGSNVCWTEDEATTGLVESIPQATWTSPSQIANMQDQPWSVSAAGSTIYWVNYTSGGAVSSSTGGQVTNQSMPVRVASDSVGVFWTNQGTAAANGSLMTAAPDLSSPTELAKNLASPVGLAIDSTTVYFGVTGSTGGGLWKVARP